MGTYFAGVADKYLDIIVDCVGLVSTTRKMLNCCNGITVVQKTLMGASILLGYWMNSLVMLLIM